MKEQLGNCYCYLKGGNIDPVISSHRNFKGNKASWCTYITAHTFAIVIEKGKIVKHLIL